MTDRAHDPAGRRGTTRLTLPLWLVLVGGAIVIVGVPIQAFTIAAYVRGAGEGAIDAHLMGSFFVHVGQLLIVVGAIWAWWGRWTQTLLAVAFLVLAVAQLAFLGDTGRSGGWVNGLHGFLALVILLAGGWYATRAWSELRTREREAIPTMEAA
ncbi:MAG: hypothetical protein ICV67_02970 [Thermoleophilia bacterium]|nr:hypothetical protein [Thermoleophilia bacterium]